MEQVPFWKSYLAWGLLLNFKVIFFYMGIGALITGPLIFFADPTDLNVTLSLQNVTQTQAGIGITFIGLLLLVTYFKLVNKVKLWLSKFKPEEGDL